MMKTLQYKNLSNDPILKTLQANIALIHKLSLDINNQHLTSQLVRSANSCRTNFVHYKFDIDTRPVSAIKSLFDVLGSSREVTLWLELLRTFKQLPYNESIELQDYFQHFSYMLIKKINTAIAENNIIWNTTGAKIFYHNADSLTLFSTAKAHAISLYELLQEHPVPFLNILIINSATSIIAQIIEGQGFIQYFPRKYIKFLNDSLKQIHSVISHLNQLIYCINVDKNINISPETIKYYILEYEKLALILCGLINNLNRKTNEAEEQLATYKTQLKLQGQII